MKVTAKGKILYSEHEIQSAFFDWVNAAMKIHPQLGYFFSIPNGSNKSPAARMKFQREGLRRGVPDVCCPIPSIDGQYIGLWIEFKASAGGVVSLDQREWIENLKRLQHRVAVCTDTETAIEIAKEHLGI